VGEVDTPCIGRPLLSRKLTDIKSIRFKESEHVFSKIRKGGAYILRVAHRSHL
jgi:hypothetical protein